MKRIFRKSMAVLLSAAFLFGTLPDLSYHTVAETQHVPSAADYLRIMDIDECFAARVLPDGSFEAMVDEYLEAEMLRYRIENDSWAIDYTEEEFRNRLEKEGHRSSYEQLRSENNYVAVSVNAYGSYALLREDGTVALNKVAEERLDYGEHKYSDDYKSWTDIVDVKLGGYSLLGLKEDGTVEFSRGQLDMTEGTPADEWRDVIAIENNDIIIGLKKDGTVYYWHDYDSDEITPFPDQNLSLREIEGWTDIVQVAVGLAHVIGVKSDGTVVAAGENHCGQCDVENWTDIVQVATNQCHTVGLKRDGTVVAVGEAENREYGIETGRLEVDHLRDVAAVYANYYYTVAVHTNGEIEVVGQWPEQYGAADVATPTVGSIEKWSPLICVPQAAEDIAATTDPEGSADPFDAFEHIAALYPYVNGYGVIRDIDRLSSGDHYHFIRWDKEPVLDNEISTYYIARNNTPLLNGDQSVLMNMPDGFQLMDYSGNHLRFFDYDEYLLVSYPQEGLILAEEKAQEGQIYGDVVYYDELGNEKMRFSGYRSLGLASCFGGGRAFLCKVSNSTELKEYSLGTGWPVEWTILDPEGNMKPLYFANPEILTEGPLLSTMQELVSPSNSHLILPKGYILSEVRPFVAGEKYASGLVTLYYTTYDPDWKKENTYLNSLHIPAYISRDGGIYLCNYATHNEEISCCINNCIYIKYDEAIVDIDSGAVTRIEELPLYQSIESSSNRVYLSSINFLDDGNIFFLIKSDASSDTAVIMRPNGEIVEKDTRDIESRPIYGLDQMFYEHFPKLKYCTGTYYNWQVTSGELDRILPREGLYPFTGKVERGEGPLYGNYGYGFADIWGNTVIEPQYALVSQFANGCALACKQANDGLYSNGTYSQLVMIDAQGNEIEGIAPPVPSDYSYQPLLSADPYSRDSILERVDVVLETDGQFRAATNLAILPVTAGETVGYLYDIATLNVPNLIKHAYSDVTRQYREDAAWIIAKSLIGEYDPYELTYSAVMLQEFANSDELKEVDSAQKFARKFSKCLDSSGGNDPKIDAKLLKGYKILGKFIDELEVSLDEQMVLYLLTCNYSSNMEYLEDSIAACEGKNDEMAEIYRLVLEELDDYYHQYLANAAAQISSFAISDMLFSEANFDMVEWLLSANDISLEKALNTANVSIMKKQGYTEAFSKQTTNMILFAHWLAVSFAQNVGTDDTYSIMQDLYENTIVLNSMISELAFAKTTSYGDRTNLVNKAIALGEYRLTVLDNVAKYYEVCYSGEVFIDISGISIERMQIRNALNWLRTVPLE